MFLAGLAAILALRSRGSGADRWAWACFSAATAAYLVGGVVTAVLSRSTPVVEHPGWSDLGFTAFYPFVWAGLVLHAAEPGAPGRGRGAGWTPWSPGSPPRHWPPTPR